MAKATIKSKTGTIVTIEGTDKEVSDILTQLEAVSHVTSSKGTLKKMASNKKEQKKRAVASDLIVSLKEKGFFDKPKELNEISHALQERGHRYPITTLSGVMIGVVQKELLKRKKVDGRWVYYAK